MDFAALLLIALLAWLAIRRENERESRAKFRMFKGEIE